MFGWFRSSPRCPIDPDARAWVDRWWAWLETEFGLDRLREVEVILPRPEYFPDPYQGTDDDARCMLDRVSEYMGIDAGVLELSIYEDRNPVHDEKGRQATAVQFHNEAGRFHIWVEASNLNDPLALVATLAHELGHVHLLGHGRIPEDTEDHEPLTDLLTVFLGLGVFTANSVIREQYWDSGNASGWNIGRSGYLSMPEFGYAFARFARARDEDGAAWSRELRPDVRSAFDEAMRFLAQ